MNIFWKITITALVLAVAGLVTAMVLAWPVQRTIFRISEQSGLEQLLADEILAIDGVHGVRFEPENHMLVVDHCPELEHRQLLQVISARGSEALMLSSKRIRALQTSVFQAAPGGPGSSRVCRQDRPCATSASWRELLVRWRGGNNP